MYTWIFINEIKLNAILMTVNVFLKLILSLLNVSIHWKIPLRTGHVDTKKTKTKVRHIKMDHVILRQEKMDFRDWRQSSLAFYLSHKSLDKTLNNYSITAETKVIGFLIRGHVVYYCILIFRFLGSTFCKIKLKLVFCTLFHFNKLGDTKYIFLA